MNHLAKETKYIMDLRYWREFPNGFELLFLPLGKFLIVRHGDEYRTSFSNCYDSIPIYRITPLVARHLQTTSTLAAAQKQVGCF